MYDIEKIKIDLENQFPEYTFSHGKRLFSKCIIAKNTRFSGADVFVKEDRLIVMAGIPETKNRFLIGSGVVFLKLFVKSFSEPSIKIKDFLKQEYSNVILK